MIKDTGRVMDLLTIVEKVANVAPGLNHITSEAMAELREIHENIRKTKEAEQNKPVTPAPVGDPESPPPTPSGEAQNPALAQQPTASTPTNRPIDAKTPTPPVGVQPRG